MFSVQLLFLFLCNHHLPVVMQSRLEQRSNIKFMAKSGLTPIQTWRSLQTVFQGETLSKVQVRMWHKRFLGGDDSVKDKPRSGRPASRLQHVNQIDTKLREDCRKTLHQLSAEVGIPESTIHKVIKKDLKLSKKAAKHIPRVLTAEQKRHRKNLSEINLECLCTEKHFLDKIIAGDETWISLYQNETKMESCQWLPCGSACPLKALKSRTGRKSMLILFHDAYGVIHMEFVPPGETVDSDFYCQVLDRLLVKIRRKCPGMWTGGVDGATNRDFHLLHDNAMPHTSYITLGYISEHDISLVAHPQYSPDLSPCDFWTFPYLKKCLCGRHFENIDAVQREVRRIMFHDTPKELFFQCMSNLAIRWKKCSAADGQYFEGLNLEISDISEAEVTQDETSDDDDE